MNIVSWNMLEFCVLGLGPPWILFFRVVFYSPVHPTYFLRRFMYHLARKIARKIAQLQP